MRLIMLGAVGISLCAWPCSEFEEMINEHAKLVALRQITQEELDGVVAKNLGASPEICAIHELVAFLRFEDFVIDGGGFASVSEVDIVQSLERTRTSGNYVEGIEERLVEFSEISEDTFERIVFHYFLFQESVDVRAVRRLANHQEYFVVLPFGEGHKSIGTLEIFQALHAIGMRNERQRESTAQQHQRRHSMWSGEQGRKREFNDRSMSSVMAD